MFVDFGTAFLNIDRIEGIRKSNTGIAIVLLMDDNRVTTDMRYEDAVKTLQDAAGGGGLIGGTPK